MPEIHATGGRLFSTDGRHGVLVRGRDELGLLEAADGVGFLTAAVVGPQSYEPGDPSAITATADGRLRVDTRPTDETVNLFAQPSPWGGNPWSSKSPW